MFLLPFDFLVFFSLLFDFSAFLALFGIVRLFGFFVAFRVFGYFSELCGFFGFSTFRSTFRLFVFSGNFCVSPLKSVHSPSQPQGLWELQVVAFRNRGDPNIDPKYYQPYYGEPQNGTPI